MAARFGNNVEIIEDPEFQMGKANKTPEFLKLNPCGKVYFLYIIFRFLFIFFLFSFLNNCIYFLQVPVAITPEGPIFESNAIARYGIFTIFHFLYSSHNLLVARKSDKSLLGNNDYEAV